MEDKEKGVKKYSYIRKPFARNGWYAFFTALMVLLLTLTSLIMSVRAEGSSGMITGALGISSMLFSVMGMVFSVLAGREQEKNQVFTAIGFFACVILLLFWIVLTVLGAISSGGV